MAEDPRIANDIDDQVKAEYTGDIEDLHEEYQVHTKIKPPQKEK